MRYAEDIRESRKLDENQRGGINKSCTRRRGGGGRCRGGGVCGGADTATLHSRRRQEEESFSGTSAALGLLLPPKPLGAVHAPRLIRLSVFTYHRPLSVSSAFIIEANDLLSSPAPR